MLTGNKGEWSEIYTLLKLIAEGEMLKGDKQLNPLSDERYKVIALERNEATTGITTYSIKGKTVEITNPIESITLDREIFSTEANKLLDVIKSQTGTVEIPTTEQFMAQALTFSIKARSQDKTDIKVEIHDHRTSISHTRGFSIKSQLGRPSTLLNASRHTLFRYKINNITDDQATAINNISSSSAVIDRIQSIDSLK
ncbi:MAG TPA: HpaII family restriction endonuclease, partial [Opitutae bacterium]|nr:HpaII family restriction endonuclease [Opitutae bacterium]